MTRGEPLLAFDAGAATVVGECESGVSSVDGMTRLILADGPPGTVAVGHAHRATEEVADEVANRLRRAGAVGVSRYRVGPSVGAHAGPFSFGAFWSCEPIPGVAASDLSIDLQSSARRVA